MCTRTDGAAAVHRQPLGAHLNLAHRAAEGEVGGDVEVELAAHLCTGQVEGADALVTASQLASESPASFLLRLTYGFT